MVQAVTARLITAMLHSPGLDTRGFAAEAAPTGTADVFATRVADEGFPSDYPTDLSPTPPSSEATLAARRADNH